MQSAPPKDQPGNSDCTISKPWAIQPMQPIRAASSMPAEGLAASPKTISGSILGSTKRPTDTPPCGPRTWATVSAYIGPSIG